MIDDVDRKILSILRSNARISNAQIARDIDLAPSGVLERIRKLEKKGVITGYNTCLDPKKLGLRLTAFLFVRTEDRPGDTSTAEKLAEIPEVQEVHHIAGEDCYLVKLRCRDTEGLGGLLRDRFGAIPSVTSTRTSVVLETVKEDGPLPIEESKK